MTGIDLIRSMKERKTRLAQEAEDAKKATDDAEVRTFKRFLDLVCEVSNEQVDLGKVCPISYKPKPNEVVQLSQCTETDARRISIHRVRDWQGKRTYATFVARERKVTGSTDHPVVLIGFTTEYDVRVDDSMSVQWMSTHDAYNHLVSVLAEALPNV